MEARTQERLARNEAFFRQVNERINDVADGFHNDGGAYHFVCECSDPGCTERIELSLADYEWVRANPARFVLARGHTVPEIEHVVERDGDHVVVEKRGIAARIATKLNTRPSET
ncbi:MAG TPA: hypothetical protein VKU84_16675 [Stellaceae bacterium]|nr:hypothetical protein [Stellaceae bacterium]